MADIERLIPHILRWECGVLKKDGQTNREYFQIARKKGWSDKKSDRGGKTMCGVTLKTFTEYRKKKGLPAPTAQELRDIDYDTWLDVLRTLFWNRWKADQIQNQSIANLVVDWVWGSGEWGIKHPQGVLGVKKDGIVGPKTLAAINGGEPSTVFKQLWLRRKSHFESVAKGDGQSVNLKGWLNRLNSLKFSSV